jgi:hypothetical protein
MGDNLESTWAAFICVSTACNSKREETKEGRRREEKKGEKERGKGGEEKTSYISPQAMYILAWLTSVNQLIPMIVDQKRAKEVAPLIGHRPIGGLCGSVMPPQGTPCRAMPDRNGLKARSAFSPQHAPPAPTHPKFVHTAGAATTAKPTRTHTPNPPGSAHPTLSTCCMLTQIPPHSNRAHPPAPPTETWDISLGTMSSSVLPNPLCAQ